MPSCQIFTEEEIASLRRGGEILRECLQHVAKAVKPGITTGELDKMAEAFIAERGGKSAFKGYHGFPATLCISVNEECVHGIPGPRVLKEGDIVSLDGGVLYDDLYTDACVSVGVGRISPQAQKLLHVTEDALNRAVALVKAGVKVGDLSSLIQKTVESAGFKCIPALTGHGLGDTLHQFPDVPNVGKAGTGPILPPNTIIAIEPIVSAGSPEILQGEDGWTLSVKDGALSAHFEHTVLLTPQGCDIIA